jgi:hypothetical protein
MYSGRMSYDLMVFEPDAAPKSREEFLKWHTAQTNWNEEESYDDPAVSSPRLQSWLADMFISYPPMNGPAAPTEIPEDESALTDYGIREQIVYACFAWSKAQAAYDDVVRLAAKHHLGFFNVSSANSEVWLPLGEQLALAYQETPPSD